MRRILVSPYNRRAILAERRKLRNDKLPTLVAARWRT